jgi:hypothetical protein
MVREGWIALAFAPGTAVEELEIDAATTFVWDSLEKILDVVAEMYRHGKQRAPSDAILGALEALFHLTAQKQFDQVEALIESADFERLAPEFIVGIARATANISSRLESWRGFIVDARRELGQRGFDADEALAGLIEHGEPGGAE